LADSGAAYSAPSLTGDGSGDNDVLVEGPDNSLLEWQEFSDSNWSRYTADGPGTTFSAPSAVGWEYFYDMSVAWEGPDDSLQFMWGIPWWAPGAGGYETIAGPHTTYSAPAIAVANNTTAVTLQGPNNCLDFYWQTLGTSAWNEQSVSGRLTTFGPPAIGEGNNTTAITVQGPNRQLLFFWQTYGSGSENWNFEYASARYNLY
ncbi:MAG TPA: hypothetical protein VMD59_21040, partial [Acidimicrobiales bacterium]|nr:hypothetical protein [Acidimicrobiales bacterium]